MHVILSTDIGDVGACYVKTIHALIGDDECTNMERGYEEKGEESSYLKSKKMRKVASLSPIFCRWIDVSVAIKFQGVNWPYSFARVFFLKKKLKAGY